MDIRTHQRIDPRLVGAPARLGEREAEAGTVAVRKRGEGKKQEVLGRSEFVERVMEQIRTRAAD